MPLDEEQERLRAAGRLALLLGVPTFALSQCLAVLSTYLPLLAVRFTSSTSVIGLLVGGEGFIAVLLPIWVGRLSDRTASRLGPRLPFLIGAAPVAALALALLPFAGALWIMAAEVFVFYVAYFTYYSPYRALYPDLIAQDQIGRAQGIQGVLNGAGLGVALVGGGFLLNVWRPLPYLLGAGTLVVCTAVIVFALRDRIAPPSLPQHSISSPGRDLWHLLREDKPVLGFVIANALLTLGLSGLKSFVVLWLTAGLGKSITFTAVAMIVVAVGTVVGALISGRLGDRYGAGRVLSVSLLIFGAGLSVGTFSNNVLLLGAAFPIIALCGGAAIALPYAVLTQIAPRHRHGIVAGLFDTSSGLGTLLGPALTGIAIDAIGRFFPGSHGYAAMWPVLAASVLASTYFLRAAAQSALRRTEDAPAARS